MHANVKVLGGAGRTDATFVPMRRLCRYGDCADSARSQASVVTAPRYISPRFTSSFGTELSHRLRRAMPGPLDLLSAVNFGLVSPTARPMLAVGTTASTMTHQLKHAHCAVRWLGLALT